MLGDKVKMFYLLDELIAKCSSNICKEHFI